MPLVFQLRLYHRGINNLYWWNSQSIEIPYKSLLLGTQTLSLNYCLIIDGIPKIPPCLKI